MINSCFRSAMTKVQERSALQKIVEQAKSEGKTVVFTNGCFDIIHVGHIRCLQAARALGDVLVVGVNADDTVRRLKGEGRPIVPQYERVEVLAALECVDYVTIFEEELPTELILAIKPSIDVKGGDYRPEDMPEADAVRSVGGVVKTVPYTSTDTEGFSTTNLIETILRGSK
ncbi:MAG: D-glycero-beta-D-manno-heptose 1-phosphate adenylyltransferase [Armatimonadota bacterium]